MSLDARATALLQWFNQLGHVRAETLYPLSGDASFRRYFTSDQAGQSALLVDAPPATEKNAEFVALSQQLKAQQLNLPAVLAHDLSQGFMLVENLGSDSFAHRLVSQPSEQLYTQALSLIQELQKLSSLSSLEPFDSAFVQRELDIFQDWFVQCWLAERPALASVALNWQQESAWKSLCQLLKQEVQAQPQVMMHRDFHSRNLIYSNEQLYMIDFQDMVSGPACYDPVSLLRDCYVELPPELLRQQAEAYFSSSAVLSRYSIEQCWRWFDMTGLQRHIKVLGIFARLHYRDGKSAYLKDLPLVARYVYHVASRYPELKPFAQWFKPIYQELQK